MDTITRFAKILGGNEIDIAGHAVRFAVDGPQGGRLRVSFEADSQRFMGVLIDGEGVTRVTMDLAPVAHITEDKGYPGRATLHIGQVQVHIDSRPTLAIEIETLDRE
jgi:hypothetical protein